MGFWLRRPSPRLARALASGQISLTSGVRTSLTQLRSRSEALQRQPATAVKRRKEELAEQDGPVAEPAQRPESARPAYGEASSSAADDPRLTLVQGMWDSFLERALPGQQ